MTPTAERVAERAAELAELAALVSTRHAEYIRRFDALDASQEAIAADVKSLLQSRSFALGVWKTVVLIATAVSTAIALLIAWLKR